MPKKTHAASNLARRVNRLRARLRAASPEQLAPLGVALPADGAPARFIRVDYGPSIGVSLTPRKFVVHGPGSAIEVAAGRVTQRGKPVANQRYLLELGLLLLEELIPGTD